MLKEERLVKITAICVIFLCFFYMSFAETIYLKSGKKVEGKITEKTDKYIKIDFDGISSTYWLDEIERIDEGSPISTSVKKKEVIVHVVGDARLTYAQYLFVLSPDWIPDLTTLKLTDQTGFLRVKHKYGQIWIQIAPMRKEKGEGLSDIVNFAKQEGTRGGACSPDFMQKNYNFKPVLNYTHEVYSTKESAKLSGFYFQQRQYRTE